MASDIRYQVTRYGQGFDGPGQANLTLAMQTLRRKLRTIQGPYTIDDPDNPNDGKTKRTRKETLDRVRLRMANHKAGLKLIIRGSYYDQPSFAMRKIAVTPKAPMVEAAKRQLGEPYLLGASGPDRWDCSGLTMVCADQVYGVKLPHSARYQAESPNIRIFKNATDLEPDDFIFYIYPGRSDLPPGAISHVAFCAGGGREIGARPSTNGVGFCAIDWPNVECFGRLKT